MRVLVTNDDGVTAPGLHLLAATVVAAGHDVFVAAPAIDHSGYGTAIGPLHRTRAIDFADFLMDDALAPAFAIDGPPALAVVAACLGAFGPPPDVVLAGINPGANTGGAVMHSGTVGAALTASHFAIPAAAISVDGSPPYHWDVAALVAVAVLEWLRDCRAPMVLNINVPNTAARDVRGVCAAGLARSGIAQTTFLETRPGHLTMQPPPYPPPEPGTDRSVLTEGFVSVTPLVGTDVATGSDVLRPVALVERALKRREMTHAR